MAAPKLPSVLKPIQPYLHIAKQFSSRDAVVRYFATMYALQLGLEHKSDPEAKPYLLSLMDQLEVMKREYTDRSNPISDVIVNEEIANTHIEEVALKLFDAAESKDRQAIFDKAMIRSFYTASHLFTILKNFGELSEEIEGKMKYAKWKAVEIDRCLRNGITPTPGPPGGYTDDITNDDDDDEQTTGFPPAPSNNTIGFNVDSESERPVPKPRQTVAPGPPMASGTSSVSPSKEAPLHQTIGPAETAKAQKLCKFASSALDYDDVTGAVQYLEEALQLLKTGNSK